jgi:predicted DNA-binding transcriptional regulator AlpA
MDTSEVKRRIGSASVAAKLSVHLMTVSRLVKEGRIPPPTKVLNKNTWLEDEIDQLIERGIPPKAKSPAR